MEAGFLLAVSIIVGVGCAFGFKHADVFEQGFSGRDQSEEFLAPPLWPSLSGRRLAMRATFLGGIVIGVAMFIVSILLLAGVPLYG